MNRVLADLVFYNPGLNGSKTFSLTASPSSEFFLYKILPHRFHLPLQLLTLTENEEDWRMVTVFQK